MPEGMLFDPSDAVTALESAPGFLVPLLVTFTVFALVVAVAWFVIDRLKS